MGKIWKIRTVVCMTLLMAALGMATAEAQDAIVPDDFATISAAVMGATDGDSNGTIEILVRAGTYNENVLIRRDNLDLAGESAATTVIQGSGTIDTVRIERSNAVTFRDFTVISGGAFDSIDLSRVSNSTVSGNIATGGQGGISANRVRRVTISNNEIFGTSSEAIHLDRAVRASLLANVAHDNAGDGIAVDRSRGTRSLSNESFDNTGHGFRARTSSRELWVDNFATGNVDDGFRVESATDSIFEGNMATGNSSSGLRMQDTTSNLITGNTFADNLEYGIRRENWLNDDFDAGVAGVQNPPGDNTVFGNGQGDIRED